MRKHLFYLLCLYIPLTGFGQLLQEDFEGGTFPPADWMIDQNNPDETWYQTIGGTGWTGNVAAVDYDPNLVQQDEWLISPTLDLSSASDATLTFKLGMSYYWGVTPNDNYDAYVKISSDDGTTWTQIWSEDELGVFENWMPNPVYLDISAYTSATVKIAFQYYGVDGAAVYLDDIMIETGEDPDPVDYCIPGEPTFNDSTGITNVTFEGIDNTTTGAGTYHDYTTMVATVEAGETYPLSVRVDTQGDYYVNAKAWIDWNNDGVFDTDTEEYDLGQANDVDDGAPDLSPADIAIPADASGEYRLRVRGSFGEDTVVVPCDPQNWSETEDYTINVTDGGGDPDPDYCIPGEPTFNDSTGITNVAFEGIDNTTTGAGTYQDYTTMVATVEAGETYPLSVRVDTQGDYYVNAKAWVDWNNDGVFDTDTEEYDLGQANDVDDGAPDLSPADIAIPADANGEYRLRVRGSFGEDTVVVPCDPQNWSETEDYTINVTEGGGEPGGPCDEKVIMACGETYTATLIPDAGEWLNYSDVTYDYPGSEQVYEFTAPVTGTYVFEVDEGENDADFFLMDACSNTANNLIEGYWTGGTGNNTIDLTGGTTYYLIADLYSSSSSTVTVKVNCPEDPEPGDYCEPAINCADDDMITNVTFAGIDNDSDCSTNGYGDYTASVDPANVEVGGSYDMSVTVGSGWFERVSAWIDWNNNGVFDADEFLGEIGEGGTGVTVTESVTIPADVAEGTYRLRVHVNAVGSTNPASEDPCINDLDQYGEYEDYLINVGTGSSGGEDCDQGDDSNGFEDGYQIGSGTDFENADDFFVSAGNTLNVKTIELNAIAMAGPVESIGFTFYNDEGGSPGSTVVDAVTGLVPYDQVLVGSAFGYDVYAIYVDVDLNFEGGTSGTSYWMQPMAVAPGGEIGAVFWEVTSVGTLGAPIHTREAGGAWTADAGGADAVFKLHCEHVDPPIPPCIFDIATDVEPITRVVVSDIDHTSDATVNGSPALEDFTAIEGHVAAGESYDVALEGNTAGNYTTYFTIFVDWNQDGDLTDDGEMYEIGSITNSTGTDGQQATGSIAVPADAMEGATLMRVVKNYNVSPTNPCGTYNYGQGEDYTIVVGDGPVEPEDCSQSFAGDPNTGVGFINNGADVYVAANDINVAADTQFTVETITLDVVTLGGLPTLFDLNFYSDNGGVDQQVGSTQSAITPSNITPNGTFGSTGYPVYTVELTLSTPQLLQATTSAAAKYWIALSGYPSEEAANVYWVSYLYTDNDDSEPSWQSPDGGATWAEFANTNGEAVEGIMTVTGQCEQLGISDMNSFDFAYYPNPVKDVLNISSGKTIENVTAYNLAGQSVLSSAKVTNGQINVSALPAGVYVFRVTLQGGQIETFKIVKK